MGTAFFVKRLICFSAVLLVSCANRVSADTVYVNPAATGNGSGLDWTNALPSLPTKLVRGDTYYIASGNYGQYTFADPCNNGKLITIKKATIANHGPSAGWQNSLASAPALFNDFCFATGDYVIDGSAGTTAGQFGIEVCDTSPATNNNANVVDIGQNVTDITMQYVEIHRPTSDYKGAGVYAARGGNSNLTFSNCDIHDIYGVHFYFISDSAITIQHCTMANNKSTPDWHSESVMARATVDLTVCYCWFENIQGTGVIVSGSGYSHDWDIYGNVFYTFNVGMGIVCDNMLDSIKGVCVYNNSVLNGSGDCSGVQLFNGRGINYVYDNLFWNCVNLFHTNVTYDYNVYTSSQFNLYAFTPGPHEPPKDSSGLKTSLNINPFVNAANMNIELISHINGYPGKTLSSEYGLDMDGTKRGCDGVWDAGALEYVAPQTTPVLPTHKNTIPAMKINMHTSPTDRYYSLDGHVLPAQPSHGIVYIVKNGTFASIENLFNR